MKLRPRALPPGDFREVLFACSLIRFLPNPGSPKPAGFLKRQLLATHLFSRCRLALLMTELLLSASHGVTASAHDLFESHSCAPLKVCVHDDPCGS